MPGSTGATGFSGSSLPGSTGFSGSSLPGTGATGVSGSSLPGATGFSGFSLPGSTGFSGSSLPGTCVGFGFTGAASSDFLPDNLLNNHAAPPTNAAITKPIKVALTPLPLKKLPIYVQIILRP